MKKNNSLVYFPAIVARKYLFSKGEPRFASFLTFVAVCGVIIGVSALIVVLSVMSGFGKDLESKLMGFNPHVTVMVPSGSESSPIQLAEKLKQEFKEISEISPVATGEVIVQSHDESNVNAMGAKVLGLKKIPSRMKDTAKFYWGAGAFGEVWWHGFFPPLERGVIIGSEMMYMISAQPDFGDRVQLIAPFGSIGPMGDPAPNRREYPVVGGFRSGFFDYDTKYILMSYDEARRLLRSQERLGLQIMLSSAKDAPRLVERIQKYLGDGYEVSGWTEKNQRLFTALKLEKFAMAFLLFLIIIIASFSVVGVSLMIFFSKRRDLAIMLAMGSSKKMIERIFLSLGGLIGAAGSIFGVIFGLTICIIIRKSNIILPPSYYLDYLPVSINGWSVMFIALGGFLISLAASYYPAKRAAETDPLELLRYE